MTTEDIAKAAFDELQADGPTEAATWDRLHKVERAHLIRFAYIILRGAPAEHTLKADFVRALPDGRMDDSTFEQIEMALDQADAPSLENGRWLTLPERVAALSRPSCGE